MTIKVEQETRGYDRWCYDIDRMTEECKNMKNAIQGLSSNFTSNI